MKSSNRQTDNWSQNIKLTSGYIFLNVIYIKILKTRGDLGWNPEFNCLYVSSKHILWNALDSVIDM
jgi:hypothetical protein